MSFRNAKEFNTVTKIASVTDDCWLTVSNWMSENRLYQKHVEVLAYNLAMTSVGDLSHKTLG